MCDTMVALGKASADGVTLFAKNSDRNPREPHHLLLLPASDHLPGTKVKCTYVTVPQVPRTCEILLCKPFWIWGAEMGANEHGVAIGNEALFTKVLYDKRPGLIGMDLLRLGLERSKTAQEALLVITGLIEEFGQGGNCGFPGKHYYHNSFLLADPRDAWILETAGRQWAAVRVQDVASISNCITIGSHWDLASSDLVRYAVDRKWCRGERDFNFGRCYSDFIYTRFSDSRSRQCRATELLNAQKGSLTVESLMGILRDHGAGAGPTWTPARGFMGATLCDHAGFGPIRISPTTGSMVSYLGAERQTHFVTGTAAPCTSLFKPVWLGAELPNTGPDPVAAYDEACLFWRHEALHWLVLRDFAAALPLFAEERNSLERSFVRGALATNNGSAADRAEFSARSFAAAEGAETEWRNRLRAAALPDRRPFPYSLAWRAVQAGGH